MDSDIQIKLLSEYVELLQEKQIVLEHENSILRKEIKILRSVNQPNVKSNNKKPNSYNGLSLKDVRTRLKLTQSELGVMLGISYKTVMNYEKNNYVPKEKWVLIDNLLSKQ